MFSLTKSIFDSLQKNLHTFEITAEQITQKIQKIQKTNQETNSFNLSDLNQTLPETLSASKETLSNIEKIVAKDIALSHLISIAKTNIEFVLLTIQKDFRLPKTSPNPGTVQEREKILEMIELQLINRLLVALKAEESDNSQFEETLHRINNKHAVELKRKLVNTFSKCSNRIQNFLKNIVATVKEIPLNESQPASQNDGGWEFLNILKNIMSVVFLGIGIVCSATLNNCFSCPFPIQIKLALGGIISFYYFVSLNPESDIKFSDFDFHMRV